MARDLVTQLDALTFTNAATVSLARDVDADRHDVIAVPEITIDATLNHNRVARNAWSPTVTLQVTVVAAQTTKGKPGDAATEAEKDAWLAFIDDELIASIQSMKISGRRPLLIEFIHRMRRDPARTQRTFFTQFQIRFPFA